jgi:hypothetical protein
LCIRSGGIPLLIVETGFSVLDRYTLAFLVANKSELVHLFH